eukprot:1143607-Pelagomonas_calceolata.AAC.6
MHGLLGSSPGDWVEAMDSLHPLCIVHLCVSDAWPIWFKPRRLGRQTAIAWLALAIVMQKNA